MRFKRNYPIYLLLARSAKNCLLRALRGFIFLRALRVILTFLLCHPSEDAGSRHIKSACQALRIASQALKDIPR
jgi:hypothetical protein